jgi:hypothetical protein
MSEQRDSAGSGLIAETYLVDGGLRLPGEAGGMPAFAAIDQRRGQRELMAVQVAPDAPPRLAAITAMTAGAIDGVLNPLAYGSAAGAPLGPDGRVALYVICQRPAGPALGVSPAGPAAWTETALLQNLIRPVALTLARLEELGLTHRSIRPDNLFQAHPGAPVQLGCAWAGPPALLQPAVFEPPYSAMCHQAGRGDGTSADDVYALGVVLLSLALGQVPLAGLDPDDIVRRKLELGSFAALTGTARLSPIIADLVRGMLAEEPSHRPVPRLLADPLAARARRVAARPQTRAQQPLTVGTAQVWNARSLAFALSRDPEGAAHLLRGVGVDLWLRRALGDPVLASRVEAVVRDTDAEPGAPPMDPPTIVMRAASVLDPLAPLVWRGLALFPDALGPMMAALSGSGASRSQTAVDGIIELIEGEALDIWTRARPERGDSAAAGPGTVELRPPLRAPGWAGGPARVTYTLNPLLPCRSALLAGACAVRLADVLPALERVATGLTDTRTERLIDAELGAFLAARLAGRADADLSMLAQLDGQAEDSRGERGLAQLRVLALLQERGRGHPVPALALVACRSASRALSVWHHRDQRAAREAALRRMAEAGQLSEMLALIEDVPARKAAVAAAAAASAELRRIAAELTSLDADTKLRDDTIRVSGEEIAKAAGLVVLVCALMAKVLS